eukprot:9458401-Alexandrium_andersonii.AAC.1
MLFHFCYWPNIKPQTWRIVIIAIPSGGGSAGAPGTNVEVAFGAAQSRLRKDGATLQAWAVEQPSRLFQS